MEPEKFRLGKETLETVHLVMYIQKSAIWENDLNSFVDALREGGLYQKLLDDAFLYRKERSAQFKQVQSLIQQGVASPGEERFDPKKYNKRSPLSPSHFITTVWLWTGGSILASIAFLCELWNGVQIKKKLVVVV